MSKPVGAWSEGARAKPMEEVAISGQKMAVEAWGGSTLKAGRCFVLPIVVVGHLGGREWVGEMKGVEEGNNHGGRGLAWSGIEEGLLEMGTAAQGSCRLEEGRMTSVRDLPLLDSWHLHWKRSGAWTGREGKGTFSMHSTA